MSEKISVIIPVYNVASYLQECLQALCMQSYSDFEMLLIDDGSTDGSGQICDDFARKDSRIHTVHRQNGGAANARNTGLALAKGKYIVFVDSDDIPHSDYLKLLLSLVDNDQADIGVCAYRKRFVSHVEVWNNQIMGVLNARDYLEYFIKDWTSGLIWNKIFKAEVLRNVRFEEGHVIDDEFFTYKAVLNAKKIALCNDVLYDYRQRSSGVMSQGRRKQMLLDRMAYYPERFELITKAYPDLYDQYLSNLADTLIIFGRQARNEPDLCAEARRLKRKYFIQVLTGNLRLKEKYAYIHAMFEKTVRDETVDEQNSDDYFA